MNVPLVLVYPQVEFGWNVPKKLFGEIRTGVSGLKEYLRQNSIYIDLDTYKRRTKESFEVYDVLKGTRIRRVYPHELFCNRQMVGRCVAHDEHHINYSDNIHPSTVGADLIVDLVAPEIERLSGISLRM